MTRSLQSFTTPSLAFALFVWLAMPLWPQSSNGSLRGVVQDQTKAVIPGVTVLLTNQGTGVEFNLNYAHGKHSRRWPRSVDAIRS